MADTQSLVSDRAEATELRSQLNAAERKLYMLECFLLILTVLYIFVYIMGRRRLMRQIWKRNRQLRSALEQANEANRMKTAFIRSMSHEIRTPLNAVNGFSQLLCSDDIELSAEERRDMRERIALNTDTITTIINELLELAEGENRNFALAPMSPNEVCRVVLEQARKHNDKQLVLTMETLVDDTLTIKSNREIVEQILTRIMDNAMKFTEVGSVTMKVERGADKQLLVSITDTGMGIPKDKHYSIFDKFVKLDDYTAGAGLGLPICRNQARMLGGDVLLDSEYEQGSRFILQLPC
jgi:signal transduction histidine kinase